MARQRSAECKYADDGTPIPYDASFDVCPDSMVSGALHIEIGLACGYASVGLCLLGMLKHRRRRDVLRALAWVMVAVVPGAVFVLHHVLNAVLGASSKPSAYGELTQWTALVAIVLGPMALVQSWRTYPRTRSSPLVTIVRALGLVGWATFSMLACQKALQT